MVIDATYDPKVYRKQGGAELHVQSTGILLVEDDGYIKFGDDSDITFTFDGTNLVITGLPTSDPSAVGALYSNSGVLTLSSGGGSGA